MKYELLRRLFIQNKKRRDARRIAAMTRDQFEAFRLTKFRKLVAYVNRHSPYYAGLIAERGIDPATSRPTDFPPLTKREFVANFDNISTRHRVNRRSISAFVENSIDPSELFLGKYRILCSSGTSGHPGYFVYSPSDWARGVWPPRRPFKTSGRLRIAYYGATRAHFAGITAIRSVQYSRLGRRYFEYEICDVGDPLAQTIETLNQFQPEHLIGYTSALTVLAANQNRNVLKLRTLRGIVAGGELTTAYDRDVIAKAFRCGVANAYGSSEHLGMGMALPGDERMVLSEDNLIFEIYENHTLVTNLFNYTVPLIRYYMSDVLKPLTQQHERSPLLMIQSVVGRNEIQPIFTNRDGADDFISPGTIGEIRAPGLDRFQMRISGPNEFRLLICCDPLLDKATREDCAARVSSQMNSILQRKLMTDVSFEVIEVASLEPNKRSGKFQLIVDERQSNSDSTSPNR